MQVYQAKHPDATVDIVEVMNTWTLQMNFPVVEVRKYNDSHVRMSQKRFLISGGDPSDDKTSPYGSVLYQNGYIYFMLYLL